MQIHTETVGSSHWLIGSYLNKVLPVLLPSSGVMDFTSLEMDTQTRCVSLLASAAAPSLRLSTCTPVPCHVEVAVQQRRQKSFSNLRFYNPTTHVTLKVEH